MPLKLIGIIALFVIVAVFSGLNLDNRCDINLVFHQFKDVPVFFSILLSFVAGMIVMLPFTIGKGKRSGPGKNKTSGTEKTIGGEKNPHD